MIIIDGIIEYSLKGPPRGSVVDLIRWASAIETPVLSLALQVASPRVTSFVYAKGKSPPP